VRPTVTPILLALATATAAAAAGCDRLSSDPTLLATAAKKTESPSVAQTTGNAARGNGLFPSYGCTTCHRIPGVYGADGVIGPPLERMALRGYVAGVMKNTPENLVRWIQDPPGVDPMTAMPNLHVLPQDARDMAAYLYTLR
jgi:cytochrome c2